MRGVRSSGHSSSLVSKAQHTEKAQAGAESWEGLLPARISDRDTKPSS